MVQLIEILNVGSSVMIAMEYLPHSLGDLIKDIDNPLTLSQIKSYSKMILIGVDDMHKNHIMHRV